MNWRQPRLKKKINYRWSEKKIPAKKNGMRFAPIQKIKRTGKKVVFE